MSEIESVKYSSYTPAQKKASQLYRQKNKDKINEQRKKYYQTKKANDPTFLEYKRIKAREYYEKKKLYKVVKPEVTPVVEEVKEEPNVVVVEVVEKVEEKPMPDILKEVSLAPLPEEPTKKKRSRSKK